MAPTHKETECSVRAKKEELKRVRQRLSRVTEGVQWRLQNIRVRLKEVCKLIGEG